MQTNHWNTGQKMAAGMQALMAVIYLGSGTFLFTSEQGSKIIPSSILPYAAGALLFYGLFRGYRAWNKLRNRGIKSL